MLHPPRQIGAPIAEVDCGQQALGFFGRNEAARDARTRR
jgi:hypothetical protein